MEYCELTELQIEKLRLLIGKEKVLAKNQLSEDYGHDELGDVFSMPSVLIRALSTEDVSLAAAFAYENDIPYVVRGSGTGLVGAAVAVCGGMVIETTGMNKILELDEDNLCVTVEPGVLLMELAAFAEKNGYLYPPDPGEKSATIGGNISTNAGGMRAVKYGVTRDFVRGLEVVLPDGEIMNLGGKVVKNSSGYSLKDLIIGSEGTLGIITKAILKLVPKPAAAISMLVPFEDIKKALDAVPRIISVRSDFTAIEFMERNTVLYSEEYLGKRFPDSKSPAYLLLTVDGDNEEEVAKRYQSAAALCMELGAKDVYLVDTEERKDSVWKARGAFLEAIRMSTTQMDECDVVVPRSRIGEFIKYTYQVAKETGVRIPSFGHAGDGNLHIYICRDELGKEEFYNRLNSAFDRLYQRAAEMGGQVSGEHGIGYSKRKYLASQLGSRQMEIMRGIKAVFDPKGLLNPHKVV